jgi:hypothetical protein
MTLLDVRRLPLERSMTVPGCGGDTVSVFGAADELALAALLVGLS